MATRYFFSMCPGTRVIFFLLVFLISNLHLGHQLPVSQAQDANPLRVRSEGFSHKENGVLRLASRADQPHGICLSQEEYLDVFDWP